MTSTIDYADCGKGIDQPPREAKKTRFIPNRTLRRLNKIALKHGKNCLTDDCPVLRDGFATPIVLAVPNIDTVGWVRCLIPATPDCEKQVVLDIQCDEYKALPVHTSSSLTESVEAENECRS